MGGLSIHMTEAGVTLTDYGLVCECVTVTCLLAPLRKTAWSISIWFMVFFSSLALAAFAGGTVHGFFPDIGSLGYRILWPSSLIAIGVTAFSGIRIATALQFAGPVAVFITGTAFAAFVLYSRQLCGTLRLDGRKLGSHLDVHQIIQPAVELKEQCRLGASG